MHICSYSTDNYGTYSTTIEIGCLEHYLSDSIQQSTVICRDSAAQKAISCSQRILTCDCADWNTLNIYIYCYNLFLFAFLCYTVAIFMALLPCLYCAFLHVSTIARVQRYM